MSNTRLYEKIIHNISRKLEHILDEDINKFDTVDYNEDDEDLVDHHSTRDIMGFPKNCDQEAEIFKNIKLSVKSIQQADSFMTKLAYILKPLENIKLNEELLEFNNYNISLLSSFYIISNFSDTLIYTGYYVNFKYDNWNNKFIVDINYSYLDNLAKTIEFSNLYENNITIIYLGSSNEDYFNKFKKYLMTNGIDYRKTFLNSKDEDVPYKLYEFASISELFNYIERIYKIFVEFMLQYIKEFKYI